MGDAFSVPFILSCWCITDSDLQVVCTLAIKRDTEWADVQGNNEFPPATFYKNENPDNNDNYYYLYLGERVLSRR